jgi:hypothetical protein
MADIIGVLFLTGLNLVLLVRYGNDENTGK